MQRNLRLSLMIAAMSFINAAHANFRLHAADAFSCDYITGHWAGTAKAYNWFVGDCLYHGNLTVSTVDNEGNFSMDITADKDVGSSMCPTHVGLQFKGACSQGAIAMRTDYGNLTGSFSKFAADVKGTITLAPGVNAEVSIQMQRTSD
jgi:hypothetical protein